jgi:ferredoxin
MNIRTTDSPAALPTATASHSPGQPLDLASLVPEQGTVAVRDALDRIARNAALAALDTMPGTEAESVVPYRSAGSTLVIGAAADALPWADRLAAALPVTVLLLDGEAGGARIYPVHAARAVVLTGWLGAFQASWQAAGSAPRQEKFDLVLDLGASPQIAAHQPPHGYYAPGPDAAARAAAVEALAGMVGDFEKPKYFAYKERLCAHGRNGRTGCTACIDVCSAKAIAPAGDLVKVNPYLCAGCGACSTVCPSGAMTYAYPRPAETGARIKTLLRAWFEAGGGAPVLLFYGEAGAPLVDALDAQALPAHVLPVRLHHMASVGIDVWLAALAWGAAGIALLATDAEAPQYGEAVGQQMATAQAIVSGLGYAGTHLRLVHAATPQALAAGAHAVPRGEGPRQRAGFNVAPDKRNTLDYAIEHLARHVPADVPAPEVIALPAGAPFGTLDVDKDKCSLCMACVGSCPASALQDGQNAPLLRFIEKNCVQCGLCEDTCPEDAITLVPRLSQLPSRKEAVVLNETRPFHCIRCDKPFGTLRLVETMVARLASHPAFAGNLDRMRMCGDCRVIDMMLPEGETSVTEVAPGPRATELRRR